MRRDYFYGLFEDVEVGAKELDCEGAFLFVVFDELFYRGELLMFSDDGVDVCEFSDDEACA